MYAYNQAAIELIFCRYTGLQDLVASLTDIVAADQILLVGGKCLDEIVDPSLQLKDYPSHILHDSIYLFQKEKSETSRISKPEIRMFTFLIDVDLILSFLNINIFIYNIIYDINT